MSDEKPNAKKLYAERDVIEQGQAYMDHVMAMTAEGLHSKSDIAAELAHRDILISSLTLACRELRAQLAASEQHIVTWKTTLEVTEKNRKTLELRCDELEKKLSAALQENEPDWKHPKLQALLGNEARLKIELQLIRDILKDPDAGVGLGDYWHDLHDEIVELVKRASQPPSDDVRDAERYRWLRSQPYIDIASCWLVDGDISTAEQFDSAVDDEMRSTPTKQPALTPAEEESERDWQHAQEVFGASPPEAQPCIHPWSEIGVTQKGDYICLKCFVFVPVHQRLNDQIEDIEGRN